MYHTTGLTREQIRDLCGLIVEDLESAGKDAPVWLWPPSLGLTGSVIVTLTYLRRNRVQAEIGEAFGVSQPTVSRAVTALTPVLERDPHRVPSVVPQGYGRPVTGLAVVPQPILQRTRGLPSAAVPGTLSYRATARWPKRRRCRWLR